MKSNNFGMQVEYVEVCQFDKEKADVNHITLVGYVEGIEEPVTTKITGQPAKSMKAIVNQVGLGAPKNTGRVGIGKNGKNKGVAWRVYAIGTKPAKAVQAASDDEID